MKTLLLSAALLLPLTAFPFVENDTTARPHHLRPLEVLGVKQDPAGTAAEAVTRISGAEARILGIDAPKNVSLIAPNFFMPEYGSRMTSSIYVRGLGARIDQPVVGLSVDNIPYLNKDNYDFDIADIESIEVLRGAQSVLNGRNTMGGQINIRTLSPLNVHGFRIMAEYGSGNSLSTSWGYYDKLAPQLGMSITIQQHRTDGFFRNAMTGRKVDHEKSESLRWKTAWQPADRLSFNNTAVFSRNRQGGYPYESLASGEIAYNDTCFYRRTSFADALTVAWAGKRVVVTSVSSVQYLDDNMTLDQDFLPQDYFTLTQKRREWSFTEDLFTRGTRGALTWLGGVFAFHKTTDMDAPVTFKDTGIAQLIEKHRNDVNPQYPIRWDSREFTLGSNFKLRATGVAFYGKGSYSLGDWHIDAGLRLDIEKTSLDYRSHTSTGFTTLHILPDGEEEVYSHTPVDINDSGSLSKTFVELLPQFTVSYDAGDFKPYFSFSKGYKAGGYNTQMFSDVLQQRLMATMGMSELYKLEDIVAYAPEYSFNYEAGVHTVFGSERQFKADMTLFLIDCRDQQLTTFPPGTTTGRIMTNAGRTRSFGTELSFKWDVTSDLFLRAEYGFTNATFRKYDDGRQNYRGKRLPYAPGNTLFGLVSYRATPLQFAGITPSLTATARCAGPIYWNEANTIRQPFYCVPGIEIGFVASQWSLRLRAENLSDTRFNTFYFLSMGNGFVQRGLPRRFSATLRVSL